MEEQWKTINGYENYEVSNEGQVRNKKTGKILKQWKNSGYLYVGLRKNGKQKFFRVHRLVAMVFIPNPEGKPTVNHINEDKEDNSVENLEWATYAEQNEYGTRGERAGKALSRKVYCVELDQTFDSITEAQKETGIYQSSITACCQGKYKTAGGYHWKYVKNN